MKNKKTIFIIIIAFLALILGYRFFISGSKIEETISRKLFKSEKNITVKLSNTNIYTNGIDDIISDISKKVSLPKELYISGDLKILFKDDGTITSIDALLYGENKLDSFIIFLALLYIILFIFHIVYKGLQQQSFLYPKMIFYYKLAVFFSLAISSIIKLVF